MFPLQVVLLPDAELPLHIFEDRYKEMIAEVRRDKIEFGVVLANEKGIVNTGCTAVIERVLHEYPDGRLDILTVGRRRFEIERINDERAFLRGEVDYFDDEDETAPEDLVFEGHGVKILVDPKSLPYIDGTELDFVREGLNEGFKFHNPREKDKCGCGESFRV